MSGCLGIARRSGAQHHAGMRRVGAAVRIQANYRPTGCATALADTSDDQRGHVVEVVRRDRSVQDADRCFRQGLWLSGPSHHKTPDEYVFSFQHDLGPRKVKDPATFSCVEAEADAALLGPLGLGKTHLAVAPAVAACRAGHSICFTMIDDMAEASKPRRLPDGCSTRSTPPCGTVSLSLTRWATSPWNAPGHLKRYEKGSIIRTSIKTFSEWDQAFDDEVLATAFLDRLLHHCEVMSTHGARYRLMAIEQETGVA
ncbi:ATP-binding protein [Streptomyces sp. NPDC001848]|uniref:ATP-binding protein n=1 Tax=Streptomyces sp. NPDC001848 TaxID=3364618 RepID=UPI0036C4B670